VPTCGCVCVHAHVLKHCNTLQHPATHCNNILYELPTRPRMESSHESHCGPKTRVVKLHIVAVCCSMLQCVAVSCSELQCVAVSCGRKTRVVKLHIVTVCCSVLQCVAVCCSELWPKDACSKTTFSKWDFVEMEYPVRALPFRMWQKGTVMESSHESHCGPKTRVVKLHIVAVCCSVLQCVAVSCSELWPKDASSKTVNIMFHKNKMGSIIRSAGTVFYSLFYWNSRQGFYGQKYLCPVIPVKMERPPGNTINGLFTRSWTARVRFLHPWADTTQETGSERSTATHHRTPTSSRQDSLNSMNRSNPPRILKW